MFVPHAFVKCLQGLVQGNHSFKKQVLRRTFTMSKVVDGSTHTERTSESPREPVKVGAIVSYIGNASPSVKEVHLKIENPRFSFKAGQWVDMMIPGVPVVGGFSMCTTYEEFKDTKQMHLAVKYSEHPPALWIRKQCKKGDHVVVRAGGDCYYDPATQEKWQKPHQLILIAGGIGINPLLSIMREAVRNNENRNCMEKVLLLYSTGRSNEVIFRDAIEKLAKDSRVHFEVFVTQELTTPDENVKCSRLSSAHIKRNIETIGMDIDKTHCFLCGPGEMMVDMETFLIENGITKERIYYEKWW